LEAKLMMERREENQVRVRVETASQLTDLATLLPGLEPKDL